MPPIFLVHETTIIDYSGTRSSDGTSSLSPKRIFHVHETTTIDYYGNRSSDRTSSIYLKRKLSPMIQYLVDHYGTRPLEFKSPIYKTYSSTRRQLIDYYGTRPEKTQHLKTSYSFTRWKLRKRHDGQSRKVVTKKTRQLIDQKVISTWQREDTVHPTGLSTLQFGRPQVPPPLQT